MPRDCHLLRQSLSAHSEGTARGNPIRFPKLRGDQRTIHILTKVFARSMPRGLAYLSPASIGFATAGAERRRDD